MLTLTSHKISGPRFHTIDFGDGVTIDVGFSQPTLEEQLRALENTNDLTYRGYGLASAIRDWRGVIDENGNPVPYSWTALNQLCTSYPNAVFALLAAYRQSLAGLQETERKNSLPPPVNGGKELATEAVNSTTSSISGVVSSD